MIYRQIADDLETIFASDLFSDATITRASAGTYDPLARSTTNGGDTTINCRVVKELVRTKAADGTLLSTTQFTLNVAPKPDDRLTLAGATYTLTNITEQAPDGVPIVWTAEAAR